MGGCISCPNICNHWLCKSGDVSSNQSDKATMKLLLIGLDNAGKTTTVMHLLGRPIDDIVPTVGFSSLEMKKYSKYRVQVYDLGGGAKIRGIWKNYFALVHGIIFVVDSADPSRVLEVRECLSQVIEHDKVARKPILILINKQDIEGALDEVDVINHINLEALINKYKCPTKIESCSALVNSETKSRAKRDPGIDAGYLWLVKYIVKNWDDLNERVDRESKEQIDVERKIMEERFKRFRSTREAEDAADKAKEAKEKDEKGHFISNGNPFKPIGEAKRDADHRAANLEVTHPREVPDGPQPGPQPEPNHMPTIADHSSVQDQERVINSPQSGAICSPSFTSLTGSGGQESNVTIAEVYDSTNNLTYNQRTSNEVNGESRASLRSAPTNERLPAKSKVKSAESNNKIRGKTKGRPIGLFTSNKIIPSTEMPLPSLCRK